jgi:dolichol-phosphate mannosyltransferase
MEIANILDEKVCNSVAAIPCFNNARFIGDIVERSLKHVNRVVVIDDGSTDNTSRIAEQHGAYVIHHSSNKGYGAAIKSCFNFAKTCNAAALVILDGDGQHNPDNIPEILAPIVNGNADMVIGSRFIRQLNPIPTYRKFGIGVISFLWNIGSKTTVSDTQSGFRAYNRKLINSLSINEKGMCVSIEILENARLIGAVIKEVPASCHYDRATFGRKAIKHGVDVALFVIRIRLKNRLSKLRQHWQILDK